MILSTRPKLYCLSFSAEESRRMHYRSSSTPAADMPVSRIQVQQLT